MNLMKSPSTGLLVAIVAADGEEKEGKIVTMILNDDRGTG